MERNTETLSTRDLASPNEPAGARATPEDDVRDAAALEGQPGVYDRTAPPEEGAQVRVDEDAQLPADMDATFQQRWKEIQTRFVDEPRGAVEDADSLVANLMQQLAEGFAKERERLEAQWGRGGGISTEDLGG